MDHIGIVQVQSNHTQVEIYIEVLKTSLSLSPLNLPLNPSLLHGDTVKGSLCADGTFLVKDIILRTTSKIVGILHLQDIKLHGHTKKGLPIYSFTPLSTKYPKFYVSSSCKVKRNILAVVQVTNWTEKRPTATIIKIIGLYDDIDCYDYCYDQALLLKNELNINPWKVSDLKLKLKLNEYESLNDYESLGCQSRPLYKDITVIDPLNSTDCDDGFHITQDKIYIHIADVDHYFPEDGPCESELFHKVTSIYALTKVYHMLPEKYASDIISLNNKGKKYTLTVTFNHAGEFISVEKSLVTVKRNLTYEEAQTMIYQDEEIKKLSEITNSTDTHKMIETIMIWTNAAIAKLLFENEIYFSVYCPEDTVSSSSLLSLPLNLKFKLQKVKAVYSTLKTENGHFPMNLKHYTHFTSPIRRYADLVVHRLVKKHLNGLKPSFSNVSYINEYTSKVKRYYRDKDILTLYLNITRAIKLDTSLETTALLIDYNEVNFKVKVYLLEFNLFYSYELFNFKLSSITDVKVLKENGNLKVLTLNSKEFHIFKPLKVLLTPLSAEIRLQKKIKMTILN